VPRRSPAEAPAESPAGPVLDRRLADAVERLGHGLRSLAQQTARVEGLTPLQQHVLLLLRRPSGVPEVGALAAEVDVTVPTMSDAVAALDRKGLIQRVVGQDARRRRLTLTAEGARVAARLAQWDAPLLRALARHGEAQKAIALDVVLEVIGSLAADGTIAVSRACSTCRFFQRDVGADPAAPHFCGLIEQPLALPELRVDCPEHRAV
jgi:DNA-binding MarR family transcriptional regulator